MSYQKYIDKGSQVAQISISEDGVWYMLVTPYNPGFIADFKGAVSGKRRMWHADKKVWTFAPEYLLQVYYFCKNHYSDVIGDATTKAVLKLKLEAKTDPYAIMYLTKNAPDWFVEKVYRLLMSDSRSEMRHPDKGGDSIKAAQLNDAWSKIKKGEV